MPVDGSVGATEAVREALRIASWFRNAPEIHVFAVYEGTRLDAELAALATEEALREHQHERFEAALLPAREVLSDTAFEAIEHTAIGPPAEKIRAIIETHLFDLVCLGTRGMGAVRNLVLGSTTAKVLRAVEVPVLVVSPAAP